MIYNSAILGGLVLVPLLGPRKILLLGSTMFSLAPVFAYVCLVTNANVHRNPLRCLWHVELILHGTLESCDHGASCYVVSEAQGQGGGNCCWWLWTQLYK